MAHLFPYLIKVTLLSAVLYGYYFFALRNRIFHSYNRFYLLSAIVFSMLLPLLRVEYFFLAREEVMPAFLHQYMTMEQIVINPGTSSPSGSIQWTVVCYLMIAAVLLASFAHSIFHVIRLKRRGVAVAGHKATLIKTSSPEAPFSFFSWVFLPEEMPLTTEAQRIIDHELVHVKQWHTADKLFVNIVGIIFWFNPVFWLIKKELNMIHEFLADRAAFSDGDTSEFSKLALQTVYSGYQWPVVNSFFYSPLKED